MPAQKEIDFLTGGSDSGEASCPNAPPVHTRKSTAVPTSELTAPLLDRSAILLLRTCR